MERRLAIVALSLSALASCTLRSAGRGTLAGAPWQSPEQTGHPLAGVIWSTARRRRVDARAVEDALYSARYRLLGEVHDNADHHHVQLELLRGLAGMGLKPMLAFEQFDREGDGALRKYLAAGNASADGVADAVRFDRKGWNWDFYMPLVELALRRGLPLRAANLSSPAAARIVREGLQSIGSARLAALRLDDTWSAEREATLRSVIQESHCRALPEHLLPGMAAAQRVRDATLAESLLDSGPDGAVLIAGNGHVRRDLGVPLYLPSARGASCSVGAFEVEPEKTRPEDYLGSGAEMQGEFDFVCFTPRADRPDPCARFKPRGRT